MDDLYWEITLLNEVQNQEYIKSFAELSIGARNKNYETKFENFIWIIGF